MDARHKEKPWSLRPGSLKAELSSSPLLTSALQGRSRLHRSYQASRFRRRASTSAGSLKRCRAGGGAGAAAAAPARRAWSAHGGRRRRADELNRIRGGSPTERLPGGRAPSTGLYEEPASTGDNPPHSPSPPVTGHLRGAMGASCPAPGAGPRSRRAPGAPRPPLPGPARGSWRAAPATAARFPGKKLPAPPPREGQSERRVPPTSRPPANRREAGGEGSYPPSPGSPGGRAAPPARWSQSGGGEQKGPAPSPAGPSGRSGRTHRSCPS